MDWITGIQRALDYTEEHMAEEIVYETAAKQAYSSSSFSENIRHAVRLFFRRLYPHAPIDARGGRSAAFERKDRRYRFQIRL